MNALKPTIIPQEHYPSISNWELDDHSGTITFPADERGPIDIIWDSPTPDNWEEIEAAIIEAASQ
jgi:hypothetical protein